MAFVVGVLAACAGVLLAALESVHDRARLHRLSVVLLTATAAAVVVYAALAVQRWIVA